MVYIVYQMQLESKAKIPLVALLCASFISWSRLLGTGRLFLNLTDTVTRVVLVNAYIISD